MAVVLMFPGQGAQFVSMGEFLYDGAPTFRTAFDDFLDAYGSGAGVLVRTWREGPRDALSRGPVAQPLLFAVTYAAGRAMLEHGDYDRTMILIGHSVGELVAATLAGVFDIALAGELLRTRAELLADCPPGGMVGCRADPVAVEQCLRSHRLAAVIGADNAIGQCVVSVGARELPEVLAVLRREGIACMRVAATEPFHSPLLGQAADLLGDFLVRHSARLSPPHRPLLSAYSADWVGAEQAADARFWTRQMAETIRFRDALARLDVPDMLFVEAGPGTTLTMAARTLIRVGSGLSSAIPTIPSRAGGHESWLAALDAVSRHITARA